MNAKQMETTKEKNEQGFSMIEVIIALSIFAVGVLGLVAMQTSVIKSNRSSRNSTELITWGANTADRLMSLPYSSTNLLGQTDDVGITYGALQGSDGIDNDGDGIVDELNESGNLSLTWTVYDYFAGSAFVSEPNTKKIRIMVNNNLLFEFVKAQDI